jgi:hypothetical protein
MLSGLLSEESRAESGSLLSLGSFEVVFPVFENMRVRRFAMVDLEVVAFTGWGCTESTSPFAADRFMPARARVT